MRLSIALLFAVALAAPAQTFSFGIKAGVPLTDAKPYYFADHTIDTGRWTVGPTVEVRLFHHFSLEADALYYGYSSKAVSTFTDPVLGPIPSGIKADTKAWELPLLLKYRFLKRAWTPFVDGGYAVNYESDDVTPLVSAVIPPGLSIIYNQLGSPTGFGDSRFRRGPTAGAGVEFRLWKVKIAPEIRYTRIDNPNTNKATFLVGFTF